MKRILIAVLLGISIQLIAPPIPGFGDRPAFAQKSFNLQKTLKRLSANPRYRGRVLGTRVVRTNSGNLVEVRILKPNDRIIIVYIDPQTGGVVSESR